MTSPLVRAWVPLCALALLSACASAPRHADAPVQGEPVAGQGGKPADAAAKPGRSPYAPAQEDPNKRGDYVDNFFNVVNWNDVAKRFDAISG